MQRSAMEKQDIPRFERDKLFRFNQRGILGQVAAKKQFGIESVVIKNQFVRSRNDLKTAVFGPFRSQGDPGIDQFRALKRPVSNVLVPTRFAAEFRLLGHDAVVVRQRTNDLWT